MEPRKGCPSTGQNTGNARTTAKKICAIVKRGGSLDIPRGFRPGGGQGVESPSTRHKRFSEPQVKSSSKSEDYEVGGQHGRQQDVLAGKQVKKSEGEVRAKQVGLKVRSDDAVPTFTQKLTLAHRRRLGMAKQWSMDETQSWFRQEVISKPCFSLFS